MKPLYFKYTGNIPEELDLEFECTGSQGGDSGHGGLATLTLSTGGGVHRAEVVASTYGGYAEKVTVTAFGDWELEGMATAFLKLGQYLMSQAAVEFPEGR